MDWLLDNPLANMEGTHFLIFYGIFSCIVLAGAYFFIDMQDMTGGMRAPATPRDFDPYELAYLRGGAGEVIRTAVYALRRNRLVEIPGKGRIGTVGGVSGAQQLGPIERRVFDAILPAPAIPALLKSRDLRSRIEDLCRPYAKRLSAQQLLRPPEVRRAGYYALAVGLALLLGLAAYKVLAAYMHGRRNVGFLLFEAAIACIALGQIYRWANAGNASKRGKAFLSQIQLAYSGRASAALESSAGGAALSGSALLMVGLFGFSVLKGTPDAALAQEFARASQSGSDGGSGCGGGGGGGCGGCGGGD